MKNDRLSPDFWWALYLSYVNVVMRSYVCDTTHLLTRCSGTHNFLIYLKLSRSLGPQLFQPSERIVKMPIAEIVQKAGCPTADHCFLFFHLGDPVHGPTSWYPLTTFKAAIGIQYPNLMVSTFRMMPCYNETIKPYEIA